VIPRISVVIPTHDKLDLLRRTLDALRTQGLPAADFEILVVDDGSRDGTADWLAGEAATWDGRLHIVSPGRNVGRAAARNLGGRQAIGEWILYLDDDIVAPPDLLTAHLDLLTTHPGHGVIGLVRTEADLIDGAHFHYIDSRGVAKVRGECVPARYLVTQNTSFPREDFLAIGGFDEQFEAYGFEDMDLGFRLEDDRGMKFLALRRSIPMHVHHHTFEAWLAKKRECGHGPLQRIAQMHPDRLREMGLHLILAPPGDTRVPLLVRSFRLLIDNPRVRSHLLALLRGLALRWPTRRDHRPYCQPVYARLLDVLVLSAYCQGLSDQGSVIGDC